MSYLDSEYSDGATSYSGSDWHKFGSDPPALRSEYNYNYTASKLESSIAASAAPRGNYSSGETSYFGVSASASTPVGGGVVEFGVYSDGYGMVGSYFNAGTSTGNRSLFIGIVSGKTESLAGESVNVSLSGSVPRLPISPTVFRGYSLDPTTLRVTGTQWGAGLSTGFPVGVAFGYTSAATTEFTSLYLDYIQFLNWARYPGGYGY